MNFHPFGKILVVIGIIITFIGFLFMFSDKIPFFGKVPGDILVKKDNFTFYFPIVTSILISILLTLIFYLFRHFKR